VIKWAKETPLKSQPKPIKSRERLKLYTDPHADIKTLSLTILRQIIRRQ